jgi:hypothetical protein
VPKGDTVREAIKRIASKLEKATLVTLIGVAVTVLIGFGAAKVHVEGIEADVTSLKALDIPVIKTKVERLERMDATLDQIRFEQARQGGILDQIRRDIDAKKGTP